MKEFITIFKNSNDWDEKSIIGFLSFAIMTLFAITDLITGYFGRDLIINDTIYNSFLIITLGCFGIDASQKIFSKRNGSVEEGSDIS